jgi:hypothetical protein
MPRKYVAHIIDVPDQGIRLEPTADSSIPTQPNDLELLGLGIALAVGAADYEHHPEPRDPQIQTISALVAGDATMPWRASARPEPGTVPHVVCERSDAGVWKCHVRFLAG